MRLILSVALVLLGLTLPARADFNDGWQAYQKGDYITAFREWYPLAEAGDAVAQFNIGLMYRKGRGVDRDDAEAARWYRKSADQGDQDAQFNLAYLYDEGIGVPLDDAEAVRWYRRSAEQGNVDAQFNLAYMYEDGEGVPQSYAEAARWYQKGAVQGHAKSQLNLGLLYDEGNGVPLDDAKAAELYRLAAKQGNKNAQRNLGLMYKHGEGVSKNHVRAYFWFGVSAAQGNDKAIEQRNEMAGNLTSARTRDLDDRIQRWTTGNGYDDLEATTVATTPPPPPGATFADGWKAYESEDFPTAFRIWLPLAEGGEVTAQFNIGLMYRKGRGVTQNDSEAARWYRRAADQGDNDAQFTLASMYEDGEGVAQSYAEAARWYRMAADQGHAKSQLNLGILYDEGNGVPLDDAEAVRLYRLAAEQDNVKAQFNLGLMYAHGEGVAEDDAEALKWYRRAAEQGHVKAQYSVGFFYDEGQGTAEDDVEAARWYTMAADAGDPKAQINLGLLYDLGHGVAMNDETAVAWYRKSADQGNEKAQFNLALMYDNGEGVGKSHQRAVEWYRQSAKQGYGNAQYELALKYKKGEGVPQDYNQAYFWFGLSAEQGHDAAVKQRKEVAANLNSLRVRRLDGYIKRWQRGNVYDDFAIGTASVSRTTVPSTTTSRPAVPRVSRDVVMAVQKRLNDLGFNPGPVDGVSGSKTRDAVRAFQRLAGLPVSGIVSEGLIQDLNSEMEETRSATTRPQNAARQPTQLRASIPTDVDFGTYYALVIGNDRYQSLPKLRTAVNDARAMSRLLKKAYGFDVTLLVDVTRADILTALADLRGRLTEDDNLLIYYAGHGWLDEEADEGYWLPVDADEQNPVNWVSNASISSALKAIRSRHVLVVADSCYSGKLARGVRIQPKTTDRLRRTVSKRSRSVIASGGLEPVDDGSGRHSVFAEKLLDVLNDNAGVLQATELFAKIKRPVMLNADQTPVYADIRKAGHEQGGDFLFVRR